MVGIMAITLGITILTATEWEIIGEIIRFIILYPIILVISMETIRSFHIPIILERTDLNQGVEQIV
jgi:uncharacterized membrane protein